MKVLSLILVACVASSMGLDIEELHRMVSKPDGNFIKRVVELDRAGELQLQQFNLGDLLDRIPGIPDLPAIGDIGDCVAAFQDVAAAAQNVAAECAAVADGIQDLLENLADVADACADADAIADCVAAAQNLVAEAQDAIGICAAVFTGGDASDSDNVGSMSDLQSNIANGLLQQAACMNADGDDNALLQEMYCADVVAEFAESNEDDWERCKEELFWYDAGDRCSSRCRRLAARFVLETECCATAFVYSNNAMARMGIDPSSAGDLTQCGATLTSCPALDAIFTDGNVRGVALPQQDMTSGEVDSGVNNQAQSGSSSSASSLHCSSTILAAVALILCFVQ